MQQLKNQNGLLLQLVTGLQSQINSKNRENQILFQQYDQMAQDNSQLRDTIDALRNKIKSWEKNMRPDRKSEPSVPSPRQIQHLELKKKWEIGQHDINSLKIQLEQKGGFIILLQSQLSTLKAEVADLSSRVQNPQPAPSPSPESQQIISALNQKLKTLQFQIQNKQTNLTQLTEYMNIQSEKIAELTTQSISTITNFQDKLELKEKEIEELKKKIEEGSNKKEQGGLYTSEIQKREKIGSKEGENLDSMEERNEEINPLLQKIKDLESILLTKDQNMLELSQFLQIQSDKMSSLQQKLEQSSLKAMEQKLESLEQIITNKEQNIQELSQFLQILTKKNRDHQEKISQLKQEIEEKRNQWGKEREGLTNELNKVSMQAEINIQGPQDNGTFKSSSMLDEMHVKLSTKEDELSHLKALLAERQQLLLEKIEQKSNFTPNIQSVQPQTSTVIDSESLSKLRQSLQIKQRQIDEFTQYMNQQFSTVKELTDRLKEYQAKEQKSKEEDKELKIDLQNKQKYIDEFTEYINEQLKIVAELTQKLKDYEQKQRQHEQGSTNQTIDLIAEERSRYEQNIKELKSELQNKQREIDDFTEYLNQKRQNEIVLIQRIKRYEEQSSLIKKEEESSLINEEEIKAEEKGQQKEIFGQKLSDVEKEKYEAEISELKLILSTKDKEIEEFSEYMNETMRQCENMRSKLSKYEENEGQSSPLNQNHENALTSEVPLAQSYNQQDHLKIKELEQALEYKQKQLDEFTQYMNQQLSTVKQLTVEKQLHQEVKITKEQELEHKQKAIEEFTEYMHQLIKSTEELRAKVKYYEEKEEKREGYDKEVKGEEEGEEQKAVSDSHILKIAQDKHDENANTIAQLKENIQHQQKNIEELTEYINDQQTTIKELRQQLQKVKAHGGTTTESVQNSTATLTPQQKLTYENQISQLKQTILSKQSAIDDFSEYISSQMQTVRDLTQRLNKYQKVEEQSEPGDEIKIQLQNKKIDVEQFSQQMNKQLKIVQDLTERLKYYEQKEKKNGNEEEESCQKEGRLTEEQKQAYEGRINQLMVSLDNKQKHLDEFTEFINQQGERTKELTEQLQLYQEKEKQLQTESLKTMKNPSEQKDASEQKIAQLQSALQMKQNQVDQFEEYLNQQLNVIKELTEQFQKNDMRGKGETNAEEIIEQGKDEMEKEEDQIIVFSQKIEQLETVLRSKEESQAQLSQFLQENYVKISKLEEDKANLQAQNNELKKMVEGTGIPQETAIADQEDIPRPLQLIIKELKAAVVSHKKQIQSLHLKIQQKTSQQQDLEQVITGKDGTIVQLSYFMNEQATRLQELQILIERYEGKNSPGVSSLQNSKDSQKIKELSQKMMELETIIEQKKETILGMTEFVQELQNKLESAQKHNDERDAANINLSPERITELQTLISNQGSTITLLKEQTEALEERENQLQTELQKIELEYQTVLEQNKTLKSKQIQPKMPEEQRRSPKVSEPHSPRGSETHKMGQKLREEMLQLKEKIIDLQDTLQSKAEIIKELSDYMNEQATKLVELQAKEIDKNNESGIQRQNPLEMEETVKELEGIIAQKDQKIQQFSESLQESYAKMSELNDQIQQLSAELKQKNEILSAEPEPKQFLKLTKSQGFESQDKEVEQFQKLSTQKKDILNELEIAIDQKRLELESFENKIEKEKEKLNGLLQKSQNAEVQMKRAGQKEEQAQISKKTELDENEGQEKQNYQQFFREKQEEINTITLILEQLQDELRSKEDMIEYLQEKLKSQNPSPDEESPAEESAPDPKDRKIAEMQSQLQVLREQHQILTGRLNQQQGHLLLQEEYDMVELQDEIQQESKRYSANLRQELQDMKRQQFSDQKSEGKNRKQSKQFEGLLEREEKMSTTEILSQLMLYSDEGANMRAIKVLISSLSETYQQELSELQNIGELKGTVEILKKQVEQVRESLRVKEEVIDELQEINQENQEAYQHKLNEIRQSLGVLGTEVPLFVNKIIQKQKEGEHKRKQSFQHSFRRSINVDSSSPNSPSRRINESEVNKLKDEIKELKDQISKLREEGSGKDRELQQLRELRVNKNKAYERQLEDLLQDSNVREDPSFHFEELQAEKDRLQSKCCLIEEKLRQIQSQNKDKTEIIESLTQQVITLNIQKQELVESAVARSTNSKVEKEGDDEASSSKVLINLEENKRANKETERESCKRDHQMHQSRLIEQEEIIIELEETILKLEKGYNDEVLELRRNIAELDSEVLNLRKHLYIADPTALDVSELVRETCAQHSKPDRYFKPTYNLRYAHPNQNASFNYSQPNGSYYQSRHTYQPYNQDSDLNLGERMMGRRIREHQPVNLTINNDFRLNQSAWEMSRRRM